MRWFDLIMGCFCFFLLILCIVNFLQAEGIKGETLVLSSEIGELREGLEDAEEAIELQERRMDSVELEVGANKAEADAGLEALSLEVEEMGGRLGELEGNFTVFEEKYVELQGSYEAKVEEYAQLIGQLEEFEDSLEEKMYWYSENADFGGAHKNFLDRIDAKCITSDTLNMPCVAIMLEQKGFGYISEGGDYIKSLEEFEDADGGDCEDWAMFVKAVVNELAEEEGVEELEIVHFGKPGRTDIYEDGDTLYYYSYGSVTVGIEDLSVGCFPVSYGQGHCALISEGVLFEPQDGSYISGVNWEEDDLLVNKGGEIEILIGDSDIRVRDGEGWISYGYFIDRIHTVLEEVKSEVEGEEG